MDNIIAHSTPQYTKSTSGHVLHNAGPKEHVFTQSSHTLERNLSHVQGLQNSGDTITKQKSDMAEHLDWVRKNQKSYGGKGWGGP